MQNALKEPQTIVVLGGTSEIGLAIAKALVAPSTNVVVLACRDVAAGRAAAARFAADGLNGAPQMVVEPFDAAATDTHPALINRLATEHGDLDVTILAFGVLGAQETFDLDPGAAVAAVHANYTGAVSCGLSLAQRFREQGHGTLVVLSSVAGERVRKANFVYGSSKAGVDAFAQGLGDVLVGTGGRVLVVRPGFVHSRMTAGMKPAPFSTTPEQVAAATLSGLRSGRRTVWAPGILRFVFMTFRHLPGPIWRRMPLG